MKTELEHMTPLEWLFSEESHSTSWSCA